MKQILNLLLLSLLALSLNAQSPYYAGTEGLTGVELLNKLSAIITQGHTANDYGDLYTYYEKTDCYGTDTVWDMYSMDGQGNALYYFRYGQDQECGEYSAEGDCYNREHTVPQSWFNEQSPMVADLFIVYPTDGYVNNRRSAYPYGEVDSPTWTSTNGSKLGTCSFSGYSGTVFEPIDDYKGDLARTYFYVATRYKDQIPNWDFTTNLQYVFNTDGTLQDWAKEMFLQWNAQDPVSQKEIDRNNEAYKIQGNRNPFIDHPEWVNVIWADSSAPTLLFTSIPLTSAQPDSTYSYTIVYKNDIPNTSVQIDAIEIPSWLTLSTIDDTSALLTGTPTDAGKYPVTIQISNADTSINQTFTIVVEEPYTEPGLIFFENFNTCPPAGWNIYSVASNKDWYCSGGVAEINGYDADVASDDWLITPVIETEPTTLIVTFVNFCGYSDNGTSDPELKFLSSTDYIPGNNPENYTWNEIQYNASPEGSFQWTKSGNLEINTQGKIYFAFHYTSSGTAAQQATDWKIDSLKIIDKSLITNIEIQTQNSLKLYPNPVVRNDFYIELPDNFGNNATIKIYSVEGKEVFSLTQNIYENQKQIHLSLELAKGFYLIEIQGNKKYYSKFLKF